ncbi:MAG: hypothetical protein Q4F41_16285, partial [Eubacteriales bacterium]|nr:hypothetical protein [Eubacteriales bacterium]
TDPSDTTDSVDTTDPTDTADSADTTDPTDTTSKAVSLFLLPLAAAELILFARKRKHTIEKE